jgi:hypothetical protein
MSPISGVPALTLEQEARALDTIRAVVTRQGQDPRLIDVLSALRTEHGVEFRVRLRDGRLGVADRTGEVVNMQGERGAIAALAEAAGHAFSQPVPSGFAGAGLASDQWWREVGISRAREARNWVRELIRMPDLSDARADLFIASLDPPKREELLRRSFYGYSTAGF